MAASTVSRPVQAPSGIFRTQWTLGMCTSLLVVFQHERGRGRIAIIIVEVFVKNGIDNALLWCCACHELGSHQQVIIL